jgi:hypothetical protein
VITNVAYSQAFVSGEPDPVLSQVSNEITHTVKGTKLAVTKSSTPPPGSQVRWYDLITYSITVTNTGYYTFTVDPNRYLGHSIGFCECARGQLLQRHCHLDCGAFGARLFRNCDPCSQS